MRLARSTPSFAQVELTPEPARLEAPEPKPRQPIAPPDPAVPARPEGLIEILLPAGVTLRVDGGVNQHALRRVLDAMAGR